MTVNTNNGVALFDCACSQPGVQHQADNVAELFFFHITIPCRFQSSPKIPDFGLDLPVSAFLRQIRFSVAGDRRGFPFNWIRMMVAIVHHSVGRTVSACCSSLPGLQLFDELQCSTLVTTTTGKVRRVCGRFCSSDRC